MGECPSGLIRYANPQRAWRAARHMIRRVKRTARKRRLPGGAYPYRCNTCHGWHIQQIDHLERER